MMRGKISLTLIFLLWILVTWVGITEIVSKQNCRAAGGVPAGYDVCVNPSAVIDMR